MMKTKTKTKTTVQQRHIQRRLLTWFTRHGRTLPWRKNRTPYRVVVAEFMLQQTQVDRVIPYYRRFLQRFPSIRSLARAKRSEVLALWSGLGYNRRALYLHHLALVVTHTNHGKFPRSEELLRALPGIGEYTARAILAFAYREPVHATDVNIARIVSRVTGSGQMSFADWIGPIASPDVTHDALMDLGATICLARITRCSQCPMATFCTSAFKDPEKVSRSSARPKQSPPSIPMRLIRGEVLRVLLASKKAIPIDRLYATVQSAFVSNKTSLSSDVSTSEIDRAIVALAHEGFVTQRRRSVIAGSQRTSSLLQ